MNTTVKRSLLVIPALVIVGILIVRFVVYKKADVSVGSKKADIEIMAGDLIKSYETDENAANSKYLDKIILVSGVIDNISEGKQDITVYLKTKEESNGIVCSFDKKVLNINAVKPGQKVNIKGICSGFLMDVVLNKCALVEK